MGALFISGTTSLSGIATSITAATQGHAEMAVSNALGGIAAQITFLAVADIFYRKANLEHAAASVENLIMNAFLILLLSLPLVGMAVPEYDIWAIHPVTPLIFLVYIFGIRVLAATHRMPMWFPRKTVDTSVEATESRRSRVRFANPLWGKFLVYSGVVAFSGWLLAVTGIEIAARTELSEGVVGGVFTAVCNSIPELVIAITAVRMGSLTLAVGDIIGGNAFDTLTLVFSDIGYREGPVYAHVTQIEFFWLAISILLSAILLMGLLFRERRGIGNIGLESFLVFIVYLTSLIVISTT